MQSLPLNASLNDLADREEPSMRKSFVTCRTIPIYHNVALRAPLKRAERDSATNTAKRDVLPSENRKNASGTFSARCMTMHETEWRSVWARPVSQMLIFGCFRPPASFFRLLLVTRSSTATVPASQCWIQHRSTVSSTPPIKSGTVSSTVKGKSSHNPAP